MTVETERLALRPLTSAELRLWLNDLPALERALGCTYRAERVEGVFREIVAGQAEKTEADPENWLWHSLWFLIRKNDRVVVGSADFKAPPGSGGAVELGYGLGEAFEHCGYMTEAVRAMTDWALAQRGVTRAVAETSADNLPSQRVLERCGFRLIRREETLWYEKKDVSI